MLRIFSLFIITLFFCSCEQNEKVDYYRFGRQITPSGKFVIYNYSTYDPDIIETEVFKIDEEFEEGEGATFDGSISEWVSDDTLLVYNFRSDLEQPKDTLPIDTKFEKIGDFVVKTVYYNSNSGSRAIYDFDSVATTKDSIIIRTVSEDGENKILRFPLGATTIKTESDSIKHIEISTRLTKSMNFDYNNPDGSLTSGLPEVGTTWYDLTPTKKISPKGLNARKIFWEE